MVLPKVNPEDFIENLQQTEERLSDPETASLRALSGFLPWNPRSLKKILMDYFLVRAHSDLEAKLLFKMLILKHRWERCYNDVMRFGTAAFEETVRFVKENDYQRTESCSP